MMIKNNGSYQNGGGGGEDDGLKDMDMLIDYSSLPFPSTFCDVEDTNTQQEIEKREVMTTSGVGGGGGGREGGEIYHLLNDDDGVNDSSSMLHNDFPPIPDFPCMSSSSSSSSAPVSSKPVTSTSSSSSSASSSSATSSTVFKPDSDEYNLNNSEDGRYNQYQYQYHHHHHHHRGNDYIQDEQQHDSQETVGGLSPTASMEISLPPPDDSNITNNGDDDFDCINVMETFEYMDLLENTDIWDPSSIFETETENPQEQGQGGDHDGFYQLHQYQTSQEQQQQEQSNEDDEDGNDGLYFLRGNRELGGIFLDWLKQNKDFISAEDMRSIKLKRSTVDCALNRLGDTKEGQKQLLKLILKWVEQYQLQKKRARETNQPQSMNPNPNVNLNCNQIPSDPNNCFSPSAIWAPLPPCVQEAGSIIPTAFSPAMGIPSGAYPIYPQASAEQYQPVPMDATQPWNMAPTPPFAVAPRPFSDDRATYITGSNHVQASQAMCVGAYSYPVIDSNTGERLFRLGPLATREARKKRMARHKRISVQQCHRHHRNNQRDHSNHGQQSNQHHQDLLMNEQQAVNTTTLVAVGGGGGGAEDGTPSQANPNGNWIYWSPAAPPAPSAMVLVPHVIEPSASRQVAQTQAPVNRGTMQPQRHQQLSRASSADHKQGSKTGKNLKFLLQKVLKQSDVGNLGRIVLPKKEAETHLPELDSRDGICLAMEDVGTSNVWNMRYRFWPNNKSRMYLLENTGDFVRVNGLQEGDFIVIYSDTKCGKYLIRGVKVRQPESKPEAKKPAKKIQHNAQPAAATNFSLASFKHSAE